MNIILEQFKESKKTFDKARAEEGGSKVMAKVHKIVDDLGTNWNNFDGGELAERQMKLAGYEFYLSDYISELNRISEQLKLEMKVIRADRWDDIAEEIKSEHGKVKNKDQIENVLVSETKELATAQILYETMYYKYKLKLQALKDIITCLVQRVAEKRREIELSKIA